MKKKLLVLTLTIALCFGFSITAFAAGSKTDAPAPVENQTVGNITVSTSENKTATVTKTDKKETVNISSTVTINGVKYPVTTINKNAINKKTKNLTVSSNVKEIKKGAFSQAENIKTINLKQKDGAKASTYKIAKGAFKGISTKNTTIVIGKNMSVKEYNKLVKKFKAAGFQGKFKREWIGDTKNSSNKKINITLRSWVKDINNKTFNSATKINTIKVKQVEGAKASSYKIAKNAFKGISTKNATLIIGKHMSSKEYNKLVKKFRAAGFKGKIRREWIRDDVKDAITLKLVRK